MIKYGPFTQVRGYDKRVIGETPKSIIKGLIYVELRNFDVINRQGLLDRLKRSPEIGTV